MSIQIKDLVHKYSEGTTFEKVALNNINLEINKGEFIGLIGHTGSGKSTLIQHLNALLKPTSGQILLDGEDINADKNKLKSIRQKVGLVFQYPEHQLFEMTIYKDVAFGPENMGLNEQQVKQRVEEALAIVGIDQSMYQKSPFDLSGGQKRRVAIAGVLAMKPEVLILDEPTAGLDPKGRDEILESIADLHNKLGITIILVSHSMEDIAKLVQRVIVMHKGEVCLDGTPKEVFSHVEKLESIGLAVPQISYVIHQLNKKGFDLPKDIYTIEEATKVLYEFLGGKSL
jgi:energy-coupling factor transport system ATP-binding protein